MSSASKRLSNRGWLASAKDRVIARTIPNSPSATANASAESLGAAAPCSNDKERVESLPFTVRPVRTAREFQNAITCRAAAYGHHVSEFLAQLSEPEDYDFARGSMLFLAESKSDGKPLGSMRVIANLEGRLELEDYVELPHSLRGKALAEAGRLSVMRGSQSTLVKLALWKAFFRLCLAEQIDTMVVSAKPPGDRDYIMLGFEEVQRGGLWFRHKSLFNVEAHLLSFDVRGAERKWASSFHRLYEFMFVVRHPDIQVVHSPFGQLADLRDRGSRVPGNWLNAAKIFGRA